MKMNREKSSRLAKIAGYVLSGSAVLSSSCEGYNYGIERGDLQEWQKKEIDWSKYEPGLPFIALFEGWRGAWPNYMHIMANKIEYDLGVPVYVTHVHFWRENMEKIREAHKREIPVMLGGFSAGAHQAYLAAEQCKKEGIPIKKITLFDPTCTNEMILEIPDNVFEVEAVYSSGKDDWLAFARGEKGKITGSKKLKRIERDTGGNHLGAFTWEKFKENWREDIANAHVEIGVSE